MSAASALRASHSATIDLTASTTPGLQALQASSAHVSLDSRNVLDRALHTLPEGDGQLDALTTAHPAEVAGEGRRTWYGAFLLAATPTRFAGDRR